MLLCNESWLEGRLIVEGREEMVMTLHGKIN
jgi:hypothetical protein